MNKKKFTADEYQKAIDTMKIYLSENSVLVNPKDGKKTRGTRERRVQN